ncbi:MAG TPA: hypothetical protein VLJ15_03510 [Gammaproteobacteria bacterium]|nr:hypothetical protein [Gammaproteobacteria bacterium]
MIKYIFHGLVLPERASVFIKKGNCSYPDNNIEINLECSFSKVVAECSSVNNIELLTLKNYVEMATRNIVDSIGYTTACGYDVEIESAYNLETKELTIFGVHENIFNEAKINDDTSKGIPHPDIAISLIDLAKLCGRNIELQIALSDFREAIRQPNSTSFHCYRAIEALKHTFGSDEQTQWEGLRESLQIDRNDIRLVQESARPLRHGKPAPQTWDDRKRHMLITWQIIKKYIELIQA